MGNMIAAAVALTASECTSGSGLTTGTSGAPKLSTVPSSICCTDLQPMGEPTLYVLAEGNCQLSGRKAATFANDGLKQKRLKIATSLSSLLTDGAGWAAHPGLIAA